MAKRKEKQEEERVQRSRDLDLMKECEERVSEWNQIDNQLCEPGRSKDERKELLRRIRVIDPQYNTGYVGGIPSARKRARRIRHKYFTMEKNADDGEVKWIERRNSRRLGMNQNEGEENSDGGSQGEDISRDGNGE